MLGVVTVFRQDEPVSTLSTIIHSQLTISYILLNTIGCEVRMPFLQLLCDNMNTFLINSSLEAACDTVGSNYLLLHRGYASVLRSSSIFIGQSFNSIRKNDTGFLRVKK